MASGGVVTFLPIQEGEGDPSPTNVRPIRPRLYIDGIGAVWGGTLNPGTGELVNEWYNLDPTAVPWSLSGSNRYSAGNSVNKPNSKYSTNWHNVVMSNKYSTPNPGGGGSASKGQICFNNTSGLFIYDNRFATVDSFRESLGNVQILYPIANSTTYHLTATKLNQAIQQLGLQMPSAIEMRRRVLLAQDMSHNMIPSGYRRVYMIGARDSTYSHVNTGFIPTQSSVFELTYNKIKYRNNTNAIAGCANLNNGSGGFIIGSDRIEGTEYNFWFRAISGIYQGAANSETFNEVHSVKLYLENGTAYYIRDGVTYSYNPPSLEASPEQPFYLFGRRQGSGIYGGTFYGDIGRTKIWDNGTLVRDLIPCLRVSDNKAGFYDLCGSICEITNSPFYIPVNNNVNLVAVEKGD